MSESGVNLGRAFACSMALALAGCATHPYVPFEPISVARTESVSLGTAIDYANAARARYEQALIADAERRSSVANGLIVLGATVLGLAALDAHRDSLIVAGLAGGAGYALGTWNDSRPRELVYVEGMKAMSCAVDAVMPLAISSREAGAFSADLAALRGSIAELNKELAAVDGLVAGAAGPSQTQALIDAAKADVATARTLVRTADETYVAGRKLERETGRAGLNLVNTVNTIGAHVADALRGTQADLAALPGVIAGLAKSAEIFAPGAGLAESLASAMGKSAPGVAGDPAAVKKQSTAQRSAEDALRAALGRLKAAALQLASDVRRVSLLVEGVNAGQALEKLKSCRVQVDLDIRISPSQLSFAAKQPGEKRVLITGGKKPYSAILLETGAPLEVRAPFFGDSSFSVVASDKTTEGASYTILVSDAADRRKELPVLIQPPPAQSPKSAAAPDPKAGDKAANGGSRPRAEIERIQRALCVRPVDGKFGDQTRLAVEIYEDQTGTPAAEIDGVLTAEQFDKLDTLSGACGDDRQNSFERELNAEQLNAIAAKLGHPDGRLDAEFRKRLAALKLPADFVADPKNAVAVKAQRKGQLTPRLRSYIDGL